MITNKSQWTVISFHITELQGKYSIHKIQKSPAFFFAFFPPHISSLRRDGQEQCFLILIEF